MGLCCSLNLAVERTNGSRFLFPCSTLDFVGVIPSPRSTTEGLNTESISWSVCTSRRSFDWQNAITVFAEAGDNSVGKGLV